MIGILYNIRSVYNVGSMFRTADGAGIEKLYLFGFTPTPLDQFDKKRADFAKVSLGAEDFFAWEKIGTNGTDVKPLYDLITKLKNDGYAIVALERHAAAIQIDAVSVPWDKTALIVGNEVQGMPEELLALADHIVEIPMRGKKESLNVSVAFGIAAYALSLRNGAK